MFLDRSDCMGKVWICTFQLLVVIALANKSMIELIDEIKLLDEELQRIGFGKVLKRRNTLEVCYYFTSSRVRISEYILITDDIMDPCVDHIVNVKFQCITAAG